MTAVSYTNDGKDVKVAQNYLNFMGIIPIYDVIVKFGFRKSWGWLKCVRVLMYTSTSGLFTYFMRENMHISQIS